MSVAINRRRVSGGRSASYRRLEYIYLEGGAVTNGFTLDYKIHRSDKISIRFLLDERDVYSTLYPLIINKFVYNDPNNFFIGSYKISDLNQNCDLIRIADTWNNAKSGFTHMFTRGKYIYMIYIDLPNNTVRLNNGRVNVLNPGGQNTNDSRLYDSDGYTLGDVVIFNASSSIGSFPARFYEFKVEGKSYIYPILDENNVVCLYDEIRDRKYYADGNVFQAGPYYVAMPQTYDYETEYVKFEAAGADTAPRLYFYNLPADGYLTCDFTFDSWGNYGNYPVAFRFEIYDESNNYIAERTIAYERIINHAIMFEKGANDLEINISNVTLPYRVQKTKLRYHVKANDYGVTTKYVGVCMGAPITFREFKVYDLNDNLCLDLQPVSVLGMGQLWDKVNNVFGDVHGTVDLIAGPAKS